MATDIATASELLRASGLSGLPLASLWLPFGRQQRIHSLARRRRAVLEAKNLVLDALSRTQKPLASLALRAAEDATAALNHPDHRRLILGLSLNRSVLEEEASRYGAELGSSFTQALAELVREGRVIRLNGIIDAPGGEIYLLACLDPGRRYDLGPLNRLLRRGQEYGLLLRSREAAARGQERGRMYDIDR